MKNKMYINVYPTWVSPAYSTLEKANNRKTKFCHKGTIEITIDNDDIKLRVVDNEDN